MAKTKLHITTTRMLQLLDYLVTEGRARNYGDASEQIGFIHANLRKIKAGDNKFTVDQIDAACRLTGASADYVFGFTNVMMRKPAKKPIDMLKEATMALETELNTR